MAEETSNASSVLSPGEAVMNSYARREINLLRQTVDDKDALITELQNQILESSENANATSTQQTFNQLRSQITKLRSTNDQLEIEIVRLKSSYDKLALLQDHTLDQISSLKSQTQVVQGAYNRDILAMKPHYEKSLHTLQSYLMEIESMRYSLDFGTKRTCFLEKKILEEEKLICQLRLHIKNTPDREGTIQAELDSTIKELGRQRRINAVLIAAKIKYHELGNQHTRLIDYTKNTSVETVLITTFY